MTASENKKESKIEKRLPEEPDLPNGWLYPPFSVHNRRCKKTTLATERDYAVFATIITMDAKEFMGQYAAFQKRPGAGFRWSLQRAITAHLDSWSLRAFESSRLAQINLEDSKARRL
jgi:hypothetical protein